MCIRDRHNAADKNVSDCTVVDAISTDTDMTVDLIDFTDGVVELTDCRESDQGDDLLDDSGVGLYNDSFDSPSSGMTGDTPSDLMVQGGGPARHATPTPRFPRIEDTPVRSQPRVESRDKDATGDRATAASKLSANHNTPSDDVSPDFATDAKLAANPDRPARAKRRPTWLEKFVARNTL